MTVCNRALPAAILLTALHGCAAPQARFLLEEQPDPLPAQALIGDVPFYPQEAYYCGPASLAMMLAWTGSAATQEEIADQVYTPGRRGTLPSDILAGARRHGALAIEVDSLHDLLSELAAGHPVLVFQNLGLKIWPKWHFAVAVGYGLSEQTLILHSGREPRLVSDINAFERTWQRAGNWGITVTPPDRLPARATEPAALKAAAGLERVGRLVEARVAYRAIADRWPGSIIARMGIGNVEHAMGRYVAARAAFSEAIRINSAYAPAWHNLANSLAALGLHGEAVDAAQRAVDLGGAYLDVYRLTLEEISGGPR